MAPVGRGPNVAERIQMPWRGGGTVPTLRNREDQMPNRRVSEADGVPDSALPTEGSGPVGRTFDDPALYVNREISWLAFNERVLDEALSPRWPLLERVKF